MKRKISVFILCLGLLQIAAAQGIDIRLDTRYSFTALEDRTYGFQGDYLNLRITGSVNENFSYAFQQRLNKPVIANNLFNATDWVYLLYRKNHWGFQAGKMMLEYGGYEFDEAPINLYWCSQMWNNFESAFIFAVNGHYYLDNGNEFLFQISQSPYVERSFGMKLAYNLAAKGSAGFYSWKHSLNLFDLPDSGQVGSIVLGNCFTAGPARLELDIYQRGNMSSFKLFDDISVSANFVYSFKDWMNVIAKTTYDCNYSQYDPLIPVYGEFLSYGGGFEFFPNRDSKDIRIHALYYHSEQSVLFVGLTWRIHLLQQ